MHLLRNALRNLNLERNMSFYAVARGHKVGIFNNWLECKRQVDGFKGAKYKKFPNRQEAELFIKGGASDNTSISNVAEKLTTKTDKLIEEIQKPSSMEEDYWPESDGDNLIEDAVTDAELLSVMAEIEGYCTSTTASNKRKAADSATTSSKIPKLAPNIVEVMGLKTVKSYEFEIDAEGFVIIYTDGSCINNGAANACAGFGVYFGDEHPLNAAKPVLGRVTNNVGEIQAAIYAIKIAKDLNIDKICISTDSQFLINAITCWIGAWKRKGWRLKNGELVKNVVDFKELDALLADNRIQVKWNYVKAHKGIKGNEMADKLAREGSDKHRQMNLKKK